MVMAGSDSEYNYRIIMKKLLSILLISLCMTGVSRQARAGMSPTAKICTGAGISALGACGLLYSLYKKRKEGEKIS